MPNWIDCLLIKNVEFLQYVIDHHSAILWSAFDWICTEQVALYTLGFMLPLTALSVNISVPGSLVYICTCPCPPCLKLTHDVVWSGSWTLFFIWKFFLNIYLFLSFWYKLIPVSFVWRPASELGRLLSKFYCVLKQILVCYQWFASWAKPKILLMFTFM